ncbi:hypothetical protein D3C86_1677920 [compost metagenome]
MLHGFQHLAGLHQVTGGKDLDAEAPFRHLAHIARDVFRAREQRGGFVRKTGGQPPRNVGSFLRDHRGRQHGAARGGAQGGLL